MKLLEEFLVTAEICGTPLSELAATVMVRDLKGYPETDVVKALAKCRREVKGRLTLAEVISRIDDGRPGADEAWSMIEWDERRTMLMTAEIGEAYNVASKLYLDGDKVAARMAFKETYIRLLSTARMERKPANWFLSTGIDRQHRESVALEAFKAGKISAQIARAHISPGLIGDDGKLIERLSASPQQAKQIERFDGMIADIADRMVPKK